MLKAADHIVVVGGASGVGLAIARGAHELGCRVTITGRGADRAAEAAASIGPNVAGLHLDLLEPSSIAAAFAEIGRSIISRSCRSIRAR